MSTTAAIGSTSPVTFDAPGHRHQRGGPGAQRGRQRGERGGDGRPPGHHPTGAPRQQVGVVLDVQAHDVAGHGARQEVERVGGVAAEHDDVVGPRAEERADRAARRLQHPGAHLRGVARAAVDAGVVRQEPRDVRGDVLQSRRAGGEIEVGVGRVAAGDERHAQVGAHDGGQAAIDSSGHQKLQGVRACRGPCARSQVVTRSTPPRRRVADQRAGA